LVSSSSSSSSSSSDTHSGYEQVVRLYDSFNSNGPNGKHQCLVLELLGPSIADIIDYLYRDERLPAQLARSVARQVMVGLDFLGQLNIGHGGRSTKMNNRSASSMTNAPAQDIHARNIAFEISELDSLTEKQFLETVGQPETGVVRRIDGFQPEVHVPPYIVRPSTFMKPDLIQRLRSSKVKIIDFGEAFLENKAPAALHTPLVVRAPEVLFNDHIDSRVDLWSMGCLVRLFP
jgi:serine/threonine protein kinase